MYSHHDSKAQEALSQVKALQDRGHSFESVTSIIATWPLTPLESDRNPYIDRLMGELDQVRADLASERSARLAAEAVLADRCRELLALREAHDLATETVSVLDARLRKIEKDELARSLLTPKSRWKLWG